jgi:competence protein ComEC
VRTPAAWLAIPLLTGSATGLLLYDIAPPTLAIGMLGGAAVSWLAALAAHADDDGWMCAGCVACGALLAGATLGLDAARRTYAPSLLVWFEVERLRTAASPVRVEGILREDAARSALGVSLVIDIERVRSLGENGSPVSLTGGLRLSVAGSLAPSRVGEWRSGRRLIATALLREPAVYLNPGRPDDRRALARRGVVLVGSIKSAALVDVIAPAPVLAEAASQSRAWIRRQLVTYVGQWSARSGAIAAAILVGDRTGLTAEDERRLQEAGTYHVVAISGGNIALLTLLLLSGCRALRAPPRLSAAIAIVVLLFYGRITGPAPSVDRAITAAVAYLGGRLLDERGSALNVLATAATIGVGLSPIAVFDPGFVLSFGATLGILIMVPRFVAWARSGPANARTVTRAPAGRVQRSGAGPAPRLAGWPATIAGLLGATIAAEVALAPIGAALFSRVTFAGLLLNFAAIPLMALVQASAICVLCVAPFSLELAACAGYVAHLAATALVESSRVVDAAPWLSREVAPPSWWLVAAYYASVVTGLLWRRAAGFALLLTVLTGGLVVAGRATTSRATAPAIRPGWLRVVVLDVGQGDATVVQLPDRRAWLVDAGGHPAGVPQGPDGEGLARFDVGERVVAPALRTLGVRRLDTFVLTHPDPDHMGGAPAIMRAFTPRAVWEGIPVPPHRPLATLSGAADAIGAEWRSLQAGDRLRVGAVTARVLHPSRPDWERQRVRNEDSVVLDIRFGKVSLILPGDIGREGELAVLAHLDPAPIVILKAAHHGSATSSSRELLEALRPRVAIFSAGRGNRFGHPAPSVVARYRVLGTTMFSTAEDGAVFVDTDGEEVEVWGWNRTPALRIR